MNAGNIPSQTEIALLVLIVIKRRGKRMRMKREKKG